MNTGFTYAHPKARSRTKHFKDSGKRESYAEKLGNLLLLSQSAWRERSEGLAEAESTSIAVRKTVLPVDGPDVEGPCSDMGSSDVGSALAV